MENDTYYTITKEGEGFFKDKGSKFYSFAFLVNTQEQVKEKTESIKKSYYDARHHCYAYAIGFDRGLFRMNDDGEPSGSAGKPIYGQILSHQLINVLIVVVRYFGGTKLGIRGLINAYKYAAASALENAVITEKQLKHVYQLHYQYPLMNKVMYILKEENIEPISTAFKTDCKLTFAVRKNQSENVYNRFKQMYPLEIKYLKAM